MNVLEKLAGTITMADRLKMAVGSALTPEQQVAVSALVADGPGRFERWAATDAGRAAIREFADKFTKE